PPSPLQADIPGGGSHTFSYEVFVRRLGTIKVALQGSGKNGAGGDVPIPEFDQELTVACPQGQTPCVPIVVTTTGDEKDPDTTDGVCDVDLSTTALECTLRAAIEEANAAGGAKITFDIPGGGQDLGNGRTGPVIKVNSPLPDVEGTTTIDGSTQPG